MEEAKKRIKMAEDEAMKILDLSDLGLTVCPEIPEQITFLILNNNKLTTLPALPENLSDLYLDNNRLSEIKDLPEQLELLSCVNNNLSRFDDLPDTLQILDCRNNYFQSEPNVPKHCKLFIHPSKVYAAKPNPIPINPAPSGKFPVLKVKSGSENTIMEDEIKSGDHLVDFQGESQKERYYLKSTYDSLKGNPKSNPYTRKPIINAKNYTAKIIKPKQPVAAVPAVKAAAAVPVSASNPELEVPAGSENSISLNDIKAGDHLVDFEGEAAHQRYYLKSTYDNLMRTSGKNPSTRNPIRNAKNYTAKIKKGGQRLSLKNSRS